MLLQVYSLVKLCFCDSGLLDWRERECLEVQLRATMARAKVLKRENGRPAVGWQAAHLVEGFLPVTLCNGQRTLGFN
jgi:hypothetical protein